ncbi:MAG: hypothetical protein HFG35_08785 [Eubacterium sp.]|nr:hypothetical protein [Eubacterium sp.]
MKFQLMCRYIYNKKKLAMIGFVILLSLTGMYAFYGLLFYQANANKWHPLERMGDGWYYYLSDISSMEDDPGLAYIEHDFKTLDTKWIHSFDGYDVYHCSEEAWEMYDYQLKKGDNFSRADANQVIISQDLEREHPIGSTMQIRICNTDSFYGKHKPVKTIECTVAGVMRQDKILFSQTPDSAAFSHRISESMFSEARDGRLDPTAVSQLFLNPAFKLEDPSWYQRSSGIFFQADETEMIEVKEKCNDYGTIYKVRDILTQNNPIYGNDRYKSIVTCALFSLFCVVYLAVWLTCVLQANEKDFAYLTYINGHLTGDKQKKRINHYCSKIFATVFLLIPPIYFLSFVAWFLPNELDGFWEMELFMPLIVLGIQCMVCVLGVLCLKLANRKYAQRAAEYLENCPLQKLYIDDLSVKDNLVLLLSAQGYKAKWSEEYVAAVMEEREVSYCKNRRADMLSHEERMIINKIRDELLQRI